MLRRRGLAFDGASFDGAQDVRLRVGGSGISGILGSAVRGGFAFRGFRFRSRSRGGSLGLGDGFVVLPGPLRDLLGAELLFFALTAELIEFPPEGALRHARRVVAGEEPLEHPGRGAPALAVFGFGGLVDDPQMVQTTCSRACCNCGPSSGYCCFQREMVELLMPTPSAAAESDKPCSRMGPHIISMMRGE